MYVKLNFGYISASKHGRNDVKMREKPEADMQGRVVTLL